MEINQLRSVIESLIMVSAEPITKGAIALVLEPDGLTKSDIDIAIEEIIKKHNDDESSGFVLVEVAGGYQFRTKPANAAFLHRLNVPKPSRLSQAALETLAIVAYKQPIVRSELEEIRGVDSGGVLKTLLERNLIKIIGKRDEPGNPLIYATTNKFMELFNLGSLKELPTLREFEDLEREHYKGTDTEPSQEKPILEEICAAPFEQKWTAEDDVMISDLTDSIKNLRRLEKDIFPKPVEQITLVPTQTATADGDQTSLSAEQSLTGAVDVEQVGEENEGATSEDTGERD